MKSLQDTKFWSELSACYIPVLRAWVLWPKFPADPGDPFSQPEGWCKNEFRAHKGHGSFLFLLYGTLRKHSSITVLLVFMYVCHKYFFACKIFLFSDLAFKKRWVGGREDFVCFDNPWPCSCCHSRLPVTCQWGWLSSSGHFGGDADREHFPSGLSAVDASCHLIVSGGKGPFEI